ncbi:MAG: hypothetical protein CL916_01595 [Deltaproteobacteria bacterium]|nr:hypothetical protein [Deltaproteobacteria bacterium]
MPLHPIILTFAILAVCSSAPVAKMSGLSALALGFWRTGIVGILLLFRAQKPNLKHWFFTICAGFFLALHFWTWFTSLQHTSAFRSTLLVCLNPFWVALWEWKKGNPPSKSFWIGGLLALLGILIMSSGNQEESFSIWGDTLALLGGMLGAAYFIIGKHARKELDIYTYGSWTCISSAIWIGIIALAQNASIIVQTDEWKYLIYMALGPQLLGHIGLNYVLKYVSASFISILLLFEPVGAGLLAWLFLSETPHSSTIAGATVVMFGLTYVILSSPNKANT